MRHSRREFLALSLGALAAEGAASPFRIATSGYIWQDNIEEGIRTTARFGFHGIEPFRQHLLKYLDKPLALKAQFDAAHLTMVTCSNGGPMSVDFLDRSKIRQTIEDHVRFTRDFLVPFGCRHFKINMGRRPEPAPTAEQLKTMAGALNDLGGETAKLGVRLASHPHIWSPLERESEIERIVELTDPRLVSFVADAAHLTLGGTDPVAFVRRHYARIAALHFKDTDRKYRNWRGLTPTPEEHKRTNLYKNLGAGGVDFAGIVRILRDRQYTGWITLDLDPPRPGEGTIDENLGINKEYLRKQLGVAL